ncbi:MAG: Acyl-CoA dehydrogenase related to the alkylation response protein AidB [Candidatus Alkanophagales archaeon MCA70_species_1]|nr:Acyl-CoA dehydrogenase related to the alkylation response protein AidB [Candidatus Alkanophaga volatiphilum]
MLENAIIAEEFARADSGIGYAISLTAIGCPMIYRFGTEEQKEKYLPYPESQRARASVSLASLMQGALSPL